MAKYACTCDFDLKDCMRTLGVDERGRVQTYVTNEVLRLCDPYVPLDEGYLRASGHIENGTQVVWNTPYAHYQWGGIVYEDPKLHAAGFLTEDGWKSRKGVNKVPTERKLTYREGKTEGGLRGNHWVERMLQNGGKNQIEYGARRIARQ